MGSLKKTLALKKSLAAVAAVSSLALGLTVLGGGQAQAYVACNNAGECWHVDGRPRYAPGLGIMLHPDDWYFHQRWDGDHRFHDYHGGRGYWRNGAWITF